MNYSRTLILFFCLGYIALLQAKPTSVTKPSASKTTKKSSIHLHSRNRGKSHKRHVRKKKQFIMAGFTGGLPGYGMPDYSALSQMASPQPYGYAPTASLNPAAYGLAAMGGGLQTGLMTGNQQNPNGGLLQSRQSMLSSYTGAADQPLTSQYNNNPYSSYGNGNGGLQDSLPSSIASLAGYGQNSLSNSFSSAMSAGLGNTYSNNAYGNGGLSNSGLSNGGLSNSGLSNGGLSNGYSNGVSSYTGTDANQLASLGGLSSQIGSNLNQGSNIFGNPGNKYSSESLSAGLDTPNGITNIANLLNSAQTSFDSDGQGQVVNNAEMNKFAQRFGNQPGATGSQSTLGFSQGLSQASNSAAAEAQSFENQLSHLSNDKLKLGGNLHSNYGNYGDSIDSSNLNEIGQIASTGISDSNLQRLLGQLMSGQFSHGHRVNGQPTSGLPTDTPGSYDSTGMGSQSLEDQAGFSGPGGPVIAPVIHGQTIRVHASDKPQYHLADKEGHASASKTALNVQRQATQEHKVKLEQLKEKLKMLRLKLHKLKQEYNDDFYDDPNYNDNDMPTDLSEKSETQTLDDLKAATEQALRELKREMAKVKAKGKKVDFSHKPSPQSTSDVSGKKKAETINELESEMLELIDDDHRLLANELRKRKNHRNSHLSLTDLDKQAEQEVNYLTSKSPKVIKKKHHRRLQNNQDEDDDADQKPLSHDEKYQKDPPSKQKPSDDLGGIEKLLKKNGPSPAQTNKTAKAKHSLGFFSIGCWRDQPERALMSLEGIFPILDGNDYMKRKYPIRKCAQVARVQGFAGFAVENGGHCLGDKNVLQTYSMYGPSKACKPDGKGGPWSMEVYKFTTSTTQPKSRRADILRAIGPEYIFYRGKKSYES